MTNSGEPEAAPKDPSGHVFDNGGDTKQPESEDAGHNNCKDTEVIDTTNPAAATASASTAASSAPSAQEIASGAVVGSGGGDADGDSTTYSDVNMPPSALRPNKTRRYSGTSEDFADSASNSKGEDAPPDTAAAVAIAANRISGLSEHSYSATSHSSRRSSGAGSDTSSRRASVSSNRKSNRGGNGLMARMQRRLSNEGSVASLPSSRRNSDVDDTRSRRSSTASRRSSALLSWGRMAQKNDMWASISDLGDDDHGVGDGVKNEAKSCTKSVSHTFSTALRDPWIIGATLLTLAILLTAGLVTINALANAYSAQLKDDAIDTANELGLWISSQLDEALLPLFAMSQFVKHLDDFKKLPYEIGPRGAVGSAPPLVGKEISHRNVSGICDDPETSKVFNEIAANVKKDAGMEGILVNIQLAPASVVCLLHPLVNTEDFDNGIVMNNTGAVGHDLLNDPNRVAIARATVPADGVVIAGPLTLIQGDVPVVKEAFIARLAINMEGYSITLDGVDYPCWGFAVILLNWAALKEKSGIDEMFKKEGLEYRLTRTDIKTDPDTGLPYESVATIAESAYSSVLGPKNSVSVDLDTTNNIWQMAVGYSEGFAAPWLKGLTALVVILSVAISLLLMTILVAKKDMKVLLYKMMPPMVVKKLRRGETVVQRYDLATIFFSDIVGFTKMSGEMSPLEVMDMLNDMYSKFDDLVIKHKVYKVETIGDAYIVIGGGPDNCLGRTGAEKVALFALDAMEVCESIVAKNGARVCIRAGLASGPVVAGVVGKTMPKFTLFGDTVNFASRMESTSIKMKIQCSDMTYRLLTDAEGHEFALEKRIENGVAGVHAKGKGQVSTWWINSATPRNGREYIKVVENVGKVPGVASFEPRASRDSLDTMERADPSNEESDEPERRRSITFEDEKSPMMQMQMSSDLNLAAEDLLEAGKSDGDSESEGEEGR